VNPARRPIRFINSEAGIVIAILPRNINAIGRVASALSAASVFPASADTTISMVTPVIASAWQSTITRSVNFGRAGKVAPLPPLLALTVIQFAPADYVGWIRLSLNTGRRPQCHARRGHRAAASPPPPHPLPRAPSRSA
jgi:hypothetical protein